MYYRIVDLNLHNVINQYCPNKFNKKRWGIEGIINNTNLSCLLHSDLISMSQNPASRFLYKAPQVT